jgi:zinc/manganese transport system permease protein
MRRAGAFGEGSVLLLASNVHGSEHLRDLLVGQVLWAQPSRRAWAAAVYAAIHVPGQH